KAGGESGFGFGLGFKGGVGELVVNGLGHASGVIGAIELDHVPAGGALYGSGSVLVKIFPLQPELAFVAARAVAVINAVKIEFRGAAAVEGGLDGNAITNFPVEARGGASAGDGAHTIFNEIVPLVV